MSDLRSLAPYLRSTLAVAAGGAVRLLLWPVLGASCPSLTFLPAVVAAALYWGRRPGWLAAGLSVLGSGVVLLAGDPGALQHASTGLLLVLMGALGLLVVELAATQSQGLRAQLETALTAAQREQALIQRIVEHAPLPLAVTQGPEHRVTFVSKAAAQLLGRSSADILHRPVAEVVPREIGQVGPILDRVYHQGRTEMVPDLALNLCEGRQLHLQVTYSPLPGADGKPAGILHLGVDLSRHREVEAELQEREERMRAIVDNSPALIFVKNLQGRYTLVNRKLEAITGLSREQIEGKTSAELFPPEVAAQMQAVDEEVIRTGCVYEREKQLSFQGVPYTFLSVKFPLRDGQGGIYALCGIITDITERKKSVEASQRNEARYRSLVLASSTLVWTAAADGRVVEDSPSWRSFTGQSLKQWLGWGWLEAIHPDDRANVAAAWSRAVDLRSRYEMKYRLRDVDGAYHPMVARGVPIQEEDGQVREWVGMNIDVTEQQRAEEALAVNRERLALALQSADLGLWYSDLPLGRLVWNDRCKRHFGLPPDAEVTIERFYECLHPEDRAGAQRGIQQAISQRTTYDGVHRCPRADGSLRWIRVIGRCFHDAAGRPARFDGITVDVTEAKQAADTQRFLAEVGLAFVGSLDLHTLLGNVAQRSVPQLADFCFFDVLTEEGRYERVAWAHADPSRQEHYRTLVGLLPPLGQAAQAGAGAGQTLAATFLPDITEGWYQASRLSLEQCRLLRELDLGSFMTLPLLAADHCLGAITFCYTRASRRHYLRGDLALGEELARRAALVVETTRLYRRLQETDRRKDELLAMLGHELRNPLAPIVSCLPLLRGRIASHPECAETWQIVERQLDHLVRLVDDLLDVSRITTGTIPLRQSQVDLGELVRTALETVQPVLDQRGHHVQVELPRVPVSLWADATRVVQVLANLLHNAAKYTPEGGTIELLAAQEEGEVVLRVKDTGVGISREMLPHIFDLFTQGDRSLDRPEGGLGIGLTLVRRLVEMHGGTVAASSEGPGKGSELIVRLPLAPAATGPPSSALAAPAPAAPRPTRALPARAPLTACPAAPVNERPAGAYKGQRILIVDDNVDAARSLALFLSAFGHSVDVVHDGKAALESVESSVPDVLLLDIGLPGMNGYEVARRLRLRHPAEQLRIIAITGYGQEEDRQRSLEAGVDHHLVKPVDPEALLGLLQGSLAGELKP